MNYSKESACNAGTTGDVGSIPGLERSPGGGSGTHSSVLAWRISWTEEPGGLQSMGRKKSDTTEATLYTRTFFLCRLATKST